MLQTQVVLNSFNHAQNRQLFKNPRLTFQVLAQNSQKFKSEFSKNFQISSFNLTPQLKIEQRPRCSTNTIKAHKRGKGQRYSPGLKSNQV